MSQKQKKTDNQPVEISVEALMDGARGLIDKGNQRRFILRTSSGNQLIDIPLTVAVGVAALGLFFWPFWAIAAFIGAVVFKTQIEVARVDALPGEDTELSVDFEDAANRISSTARKAQDKANEAIARISEEVKSRENHDSDEEKF